MSTAVCDTSTLIRLHKGNALHCLSNLFDKIYIPEAVKNECRDKAVSEAISKPPFEIRKVEDILPIGMGAGEREAISLAVEMGIKTIITNDIKALRKSEQQGLAPLTAENILNLAKRAGVIESVGEVLNKMDKAGEGIDPDLYFETLEIAGEL